MFYFKDQTEYWSRLARSFSKIEWVCSQNMIHQVFAFCNNSSIEIAYQKGDIFDQKYFGIVPRNVGMMNKKRVIKKGWAIQIACKYEQSEQ